MGLNPWFNLLYLNVSLCTYARVYFKTSEKKTPADPDNISEEIFPNLYASCWEVCFEF
jgi:hypothetical protein